MSDLLVGAGKAQICLPDSIFPNRENFVRILDPLYVRVVLIQAQQRMALVSLELTSMMGGIDVLRQKVGEITGAEPEFVWITVTHTFSAPHIALAMPNGPGGPGAPVMSEKEMQQEREAADALCHAIEVAAAQAVETLKPATMRVGLGTCDINAGRDVETRDGWWLGDGSTAYADKDLNVIVLDDENGKLIATIYNYAVQSSVLDHAAMPGGGYLISGDISGVASQQVEHLHPGSVALFLCGAAGDQAPRKKASTSVLGPDGTLCSVELGPEGIAIKNALGQELGEAVCQTIAAATEISGEPVLVARSIHFNVPAKVMPDRSKMKPSREFTFVPDGEKETNVDVIRLGNVAFVGVKPELSAIIGTRIRQASPFALTITATMVNGGAKYMADQLAYQRNTYAAQNGPFAPGAAEQLQTRAIDLLKEIAEQV